MKAIAVFCAFLTVALLGLQDVGARSIHEQAETPPEQVEPVANPFQEEQDLPGRSENQEQQVPVEPAEGSETGKRDVPEESKTRMEPLPAAAEDMNEESKTRMEPLPAAAEDMNEESQESAVGKRKRETTNTKDSAIPRRPDESEQEQQVSAEHVEGKRETGKRETFFWPEGAQTRMKPLPEGMTEETADDDDGN